MISLSNLSSNATSSVSIPGPSFLQSKFLFICTSQIIHTTFYLCIFSSFCLPWFPLLTCKCFSQEKSTKNSLYIYLEHMLQFFACQSPLLHLGIKAQCLTRYKWEWKIIRGLTIFAGQQPLSPLLRLIVIGMISMALMIFFAQNEPLRVYWVPSSTLVSGCFSAYNGFMTQFP